MEITYSLTKEDLWNIKNSSSSKSKRFKATAIGGIILFISALMVALKFFESITLSILSVIPIILLYFLVKSPKSKHAYIKSIPDNDNALKERTIEIEPERISISTNFQNSSSQWALINKIELTDKYIHFFFTKKTAIIIPKRIFYSENEATQFYNVATNYFENSKKTQIKIFYRKVFINMKITYSLTKEDFWYYSNYFRSNSEHFKTSIRFALISWILLPIGMFLVFRSIKISLLSVLPLMLIHAIALRPISKRKAFKALKDNDQFLQEQTIEIVPEGISRFTSFQDGFSKWNALSKIEMTYDYIYLFFTEDTAIIVPKRIFNTEDEALKFYNTALDYFENNKKNKYRSKY